MTRPAAVRMEPITRLRLVVVATAAVVIVLLVRA